MQNRIIIHWESPQKKLTIYWKLQDPNSLVHSPFESCFTCVQRRGKEPLVAVLLVCNEEEKSHWWPCNCCCWHSAVSVGLQWSFCSSASGCPTGLGVQKNDLAALSSSSPILTSYSWEQSGTTTLQSKKTTTDLQCSFLLTCNVQISCVLYWKTRHWKYWKVRGLMNNHRLGTAGRVRRKVVVVVMQPHHLPACAHKSPT